MQSEQVKMRFGRCPYCRAMVYQDPKAVVYLCGKCRTPIRGKEPEPTDENEYALAQLEILSFDTMSVFSDELEPPSSDFDPGSRETGAASSSSQYRPFGVIRTGPRSGDLDRYEESGSGRRNGGSPMHDRVGELRPASRRTRRPSSADLDAPRAEESDFDVPRTRSASCYQRRASPLSSQELEANMDPAAAAAGLAGSPLTDPSFQQDLLQALENLRKLIVAVEEPFRASASAPRLGSANASASAPGHRQTASCNDSAAAQKVTRRDSRILRRLESQLAQALPTNSPRQSQDATTSSSSSSVSASASASALSSSRRGASISASASASALSSSRRGASSSRHLLCRPILGGTPFVACEKCSELLQLPSALSVKKSAMLQCGGCGEELAVKLPARGGAGSASTDGPRKIFSAPQPAGFGTDDAAAEEYMRASARSRLSGEQLRQGPDEGPLHRVLGYSSVSSVLRSRRYGEDL